MANYANQLKIYLTDFEKIKHNQNDKHNRFIQPIDFKYEAAAMKNLNGNAFKLWRYLLRWYGTDSFFFSPAAIAQELGLGKNGATTARQELELKGYLIKDENKNNVYIFSPVTLKDYLVLKDESDF